MSKVVKPPKPYSLKKSQVTVFLAGSIEMGVAENWQTRAERILLDPELGDVVILNPRRDDWDSSWVQSVDNEQFYSQVDWEYNGLHDADVIMMYFDPNTKSPITLLELGLFAETGRVVVCCPDGFWRKGNVEYVCKRMGIPMFNTFDDLILCVKHRIWRQSVGT